MASEQRTHAWRAMTELRKRILSGEFDPGARLSEVAVAEALDISRTPVRHALTKLADEGLLERLAGGGFAVRSFAVQDVRDAIEIRGVLEGTAARLAAERGAPPEGLARLHEVVRELDTCFLAERDSDVDFERYVPLNAAFHDTLWSLCGSPVLRGELERATRLPFAAPSAFLPDGSAIDAFRRSLRVAQAQHRAIASAIAAREGARAEALSREHARIALGNLEYILSEDRTLLEQIPGLALLAD